MFCKRFILHITTVLIVDPVSSSVLPVYFIIITIIVCVQYARKLPHVRYT